MLKGGDALPQNPIWEALLDLRAGSGEQTTNEEVDDIVPMEKFLNDLETEVNNYVQELDDKKYTSSATKKYF
eukprot:1045558-Karenia_brevis.AAC.1